MTATHALIIGKFYPPHAGHRLLIRTAASQCARVTVVVMASRQESIPMAQRVAWLREDHRGQPGVVVTGIADDVPIDYQDAAIWDQHEALMRQALASVHAPAVTAVFTSEPYGQELARRFGATPVTLDLGRRLMPVSSTRVRSDMAACWDWLAPPVRQSLALRVVVVGAESTGTTTLSLALAQRLRERAAAFGATQWTPEYGREYSVRKFAEAVAAAQLAGQAVPAFEGLQWKSAEFVRIARTQLALQDAAARQGGPVLVCDTDAFATAIWHERYMGSECVEVDEIAQQRQGDLYLLTHHEGVPFEQDGLRDGESIRAWMTQRFTEQLQRTGRRHGVLRGTPGQRLIQAVSEVDALLAQAWQFAPPLGASQ